jgi:hypothetical protein
MAQQDNPDHPDKPMMTHSITKPEKEDGTQDGGDGGHEDRERTESGGGSVRMEIYHVRKSANIKSYEDYEKNRNEHKAGQKNFITCPRRKKSDKKSRG